MDKRTCSAFLLASLLAVALQVFVLSPISPDILLPTSSIPSNSKLQEVSKLGEGLLKKPEAMLSTKSACFIRLQELVGSQDCTEMDPGRNGGMMTVRIYLEKLQQLVTLSSATQRR
ncbi:uncharacterized protein LOC111366845 [Olea europaea var. sylvestris]|nr:uncharacterized protein LOC111366845 [Olea europaea var. sylvestris]